MESLSRPFHSRKLSNATSLSGKNAYDGVFSVNRQKYTGAAAANVEDYREIFSGSQAASSIPVLDLSTFGDSSDAASNSKLRSSKPDYSKIFGGFRDEDIAVSYEELFTPRQTARSPSSTTPTSKGLDDLSHQPFDALKQFNMLYHRIGKKSMDGLDGTTHVAQLHAIPGFTRFIDETTPPKKMEAEKQKSSMVNNVHLSVDPGRVDFADKQTSGRAIKSRSKFHRGDSFSNDKFFNTFDNNLKSHPPEVSSTSASSATVDNHKDYPRTSTGVNSGTSKSDTSESAPGEHSPTYFDDEVDVNSAAAASAAALKKAIEKAQESIRIAKESVGRKKEGLRSFSNKSFKDSLKVKARTKNVTVGEEQNGKLNKVIEEFERVDAASQVLLDMGRNQKYGDTVVLRDFTDCEKLFDAKKVIDKIHGKISESAKKYETPMQFKDDEVVSNSTKIIGGMQARSLASAGKYESATLSSEATNMGKSGSFTPAFELADHKVKVIKGTATILEHHSVVEELESLEKACEQEVVGKLDDVKPAQEREGKVDEWIENVKSEVPQEDGACAQRPNCSLVHGSCHKKLVELEETMEDDKNVPTELKENEDEVRPRNAHELVEGLNNLTVSQNVEDEKNICQGSSDSDYDKRLNESLGLLENEKQQEVEQEYMKVKEAEKQEEDSSDAASEKEIEEAFQWFEHGNEQKEDHSTESPKEGEVGERFYDVYEMEMNENTETYAHSIEKSEISPEEDSEMKEIDDYTGNETGKRFDDVQQLELDENLSSDGNYMEEIESTPTGHGESNIIADTEEAFKVDMNGNSVEASQEVDDVCTSSMEFSGSSSEFQAQREAIKAVYRSEEEEILEKASVDQTVSEDNEDEFDVRADNLVDHCSADMDLGENEIEQNDSQSESSSDATMTYGMEIEANKSKEDAQIIGEERPVFVDEEGQNHIQSSPVETARVRNAQEMEAPQESRLSSETEKPMDMNKEIKTSQCEEKNDEIREPGSSKVAGKEHRRRTDEERECEKNRLAVERAIREARERAFAEARERAERAAVERATAEVRQRVMADARDKVEKASLAGKPSSERTSAQSKLRAERAAVERATAEARQRALEKALSQKSTSGTRPEAHRIRTSSSSDLRSYNGTSAESAQRSKAKLEKHNRIMERAAKALAEKEKRDLLAQKEQAERNRLAETLDADIKRWSSGKEGNLRALLSTLQYILGPDSGWQPVTLTEIITTNAVKKAYRKATLCVHPDKLQQRGASIQQKYICEKVFDLLKAAWNRFTSEER